MSETPSPYVVSTATSRCKATEWAASDCALALREIGATASVYAAIACDVTAAAVGPLARMLDEAPASDPVGEFPTDVRESIDAALVALADCIAQCEPLGEQVPACAECVKACEACADALSRVLAGCEV